ncbi:TetR family transcriptional regulator [Nonomuraea sp. NPDC050536]|uniref:TetR family transcriptional regulator n=1 Tax=Nonomuraea sp. NPDC050536 TaxID=3364366 RepID=UPI0037C94D73
MEEIASAADVSPRTFYRYFPAKEDVLLGGPGTEDATRQALAERLPGESDVDFVARAMLAGLTAGDPERTARAYRLVQTVPALQARMFRLVWRGGQESFVEALLAGRPRARDAELRAHVITHAVTDAMRTLPSVVIVTVDQFLQGDHTVPYGTSRNHPAKGSRRPPITLRDEPVQRS